MIQISRTQAAGCHLSDHTPSDSLSTPGSDYARSIYSQVSL